MSTPNKPSEFRLQIGGIPCYINPHVDKPGIVPGPGGKTAGSSFVFKDQAQLDRFKELLSTESAKADEREAQKLLEATKAAADLAEVRQRLGALRMRKSYRPQAVDAWLHSSNVDRVEKLCQSDMHFIAELGTELEVRQLERDEARLWAVVHGVQQILTCAYCGHAYPKGTAASGVAILTDHLKVCEKHPMRGLEAKVAELQAALERLTRKPEKFEAELEAIEREHAKVAEHYETQGLSGGEANQCHRDRGRLLELLNIHGKREFMQGFACAMATLIRAHDQPGMAIDIAASNGLRLKDFEDCGADDFDLEPVVMAWRSERPQDADALHPTGRCTCAGEGTCTWCLEISHRDIKPDNIPEGG